MDIENKFPLLRDELGLDPNLCREMNSDIGKEGLPPSVRKRNKGTNGSTVVKQLGSRELRRFLERKRKKEERRNDRKK